MMRVTLEAVDSGAVIKEIKDISDVTGSCIDGCAMIQTEEKNFILPVRPGEVLVIHKDKQASG